MILGRKLKLKIFALLVLSFSVFFFSSTENVNASLDCQTYWQCVSGCSGASGACILMCGNQNCGTPDMDFCTQARYDADICDATWGPGPPSGPPNENHNPVLYSECLVNSKIDLCQ